MAQRNFANRKMETLHEPLHDEYYGSISLNRREEKERNERQFRIAEHTDRTSDEPSFYRIASEGTKYVNPSHQRDGQQNS